MNADPRGSQDTPEFPDESESERGRRASVELPMTAKLCRQCLRLAEVHGAGDHGAQQLFVEGIDVRDGLGGTTSRRTTVHRR